MSDSPAVVPAPTVVPRDSGQSGYAIGTRAEVIARGMDPKTTHTCSEEIDGVNAGCKFYKNKTHQCMFNELRRAEAGPENFGFYKIEPEGGDNGFIMPCWLIMENESEFLRQRAKQYRGFYGVGDTITRRIIVAQHRKPNPDCPKCKKGECNLSHTIKVQEIVPAFPRPGELVNESIIPADAPIPGDNRLIDMQFPSVEKHVSGAQEDAVKEHRAVTSLSESVRGTPKPR